MYSFFRLFVLLSLLSLQTPSLAIEGENICNETNVYRYSHFFAESQTWSRGLNQGYIAIDRGKNAIWYGHAAIGAKFCDCDDGFHCFTSDSLSFAVPKDTSQAESWTASNATYTVMGSPGKIEILGSVVNDVLLIGSEIDFDEEVFEVQYVYSSTRGLLGFNISKEKGNGFSSSYWIAGFCGFGAGSADTCRERVGQE